MTLTALLGAIGLSRMTNREALLEELAGLDDATLAGLLDGSDLADVLQKAICQDCMADNGGACTASIDAPCRMGMDAGWLAAPCRHERLIQTGGDIA